MKQTESKYVVTSIDLLSRISGFIEQTPNIKKIFYIRNEFQKNQPIPKFPDYIQVLPLDQVEELGKDAPAIDLPMPKKDEVSCIMYTSGMSSVVISVVRSNRFVTGTTGVPKAVILHNRQIKGALRALTSNVNDLADEAHRHTYASFLPLAHIMGLTFELFLFTGNCCFGWFIKFLL